MISHFLICTLFIGTHSFPIQTVSDKRDTHQKTEGVMKFRVDAIFQDIFGKSLLESESLSLLSVVKISGVKPMKELAWWSKENSRAKYVKTV